MPGARPFGFRKGDFSEKIAEFILSSLAFTTPVPRTEDVGHDFLCSIAERDGRLVKAGPFFTVQVKSNREPIVYKEDYEIDWIMNQDNPLFICIINRDDLSAELYSTWTMLFGFLYKTAKKISLFPGDEYNGIRYPYTRTTDDNSEQIIPLGKPILKIPAHELETDTTVDNLIKILKKWVQIDRKNIVNRQSSPSSSLNMWIEAFEPYTGVTGGEPPIDALLLLIT